MTDGPHCSFYLFRIVSISARSGPKFWTTCAEFGCLVALIPSRNIVLDMSSNALAGGGEVAGDPRSKKQRTSETRKIEFQPDGPVEDEATAREKMEKAGFDPDDVKNQCRLTDEAAGDIGLLHGERTMSPMSYFGGLCDLKMCRYLLSKGASTTEASEYQYTDKRCWWFPMYSAACKGQLEVCKWLYKHGADRDIKKTNYCDFSPLNCSFNTWCKRQHDGALCRWFILKGALSDDTGMIDSTIMRRDLPHEVRRSHFVRDERRPDLLYWAQEAVQDHDSFMVFLSGTLSASAYSRGALCEKLSTRLQSDDAAEMIMSNTPEEQYELLWRKTTESKTPLSCLAGKIGLLVHIADYLGVVRGRDLRIMRSLIGPLSDFLEEVPDRTVYSHDEDEESYESDSQNGSESDTSG